MRSLLALMLTAMLAACAAPAAAVAVSQASPLPSQTAAPTPRPPATATDTVTPAPTFTATPAPTPQSSCLEGQAVCILDGHFLFQRPIGAQDVYVLDKTYRFGTTQSGVREPHHGVEFPNKRGTPVLAAQAGRVVFAGDDKAATLAWMPHFYGNVVMIEHHLPLMQAPIYSLYAHLDEVLAHEGDSVAAGDVIGRVGATGTAIGSHLHFEVRLAPLDYASTLNPELWMAPLDGTGVLAGRIQDAQGNVVKSAFNLQQVVANQVSPMSFADSVTYEAKDRLSVQGDPLWHENFAIGDLPAGEYRISLLYNGTLYEQFVTVEPGRLTFMVFVLN